MLFCLFLQAMGSTLEQYRAAVGLYYYRSRCTTKHLLFRVSLLNLFTYFLLKGLRYYITRLLSKVVQESLFISYIFQIIHVLLILSGDVETNPGPEHLHVTQFTLDIFHLNVRSIRNKFDQFLSLVSDYDILCFTESHLDSNIMNDEISIDGFNTIFRKDRNSYGGGVIIYLTDSLRAVRRLDLEPTNTECIWIEISDPTSNIFLCCVYRPPNSDKSFWEKLEWSIDKTQELSDKIIILGDLNVNFLNLPNTHTELRISF